MTAISTPLTSRRLTLPVGAAAAYISAWLVGLAIWPGSPGVNANATHVADTYAAHHGLAIVQYLLVEGVAGMALGAMVLLIGLGLGATGNRRAGTIVLVSGLAATTISLAQAVLGAAMAAGAAHSAGTQSTADVFDLLNRMDGVKMLLLAAMVASVVNASRRPRLLPGWLHAVGWALIAALVTSGVGYLLLSGPLAMVAALSLALLLVWVPAAAVTFSRTRPGLPPSPGDVL